jgi:hypothetical protein
MVKQFIRVLGIATAVAAASITTVPRQTLAAKPVRSHVRKAPANLKAVCSDYPCPAGVYYYYIDYTDEDALCSGNPDSFEGWVQYWNEDASFAYDVDVGHTTFRCGDDYYGDTIGSNSTYQNCTNTSPWNCQTLGSTWSPHP